METREVDTREAGTRETETREAGTREAGTREVGTREGTRGPSSGPVQARGGLVSGHCEAPPGLRGYLLCDLCLPHAWGHTDMPMSKIRRVSE